MVYYIVVIVVLSFIVWNMTLIGYHEKIGQDLNTQEDDVFDPRCKSIQMIHEKGNDKAILMIHGFPSTPYTYAYAAQRAFEAGYDVYVPLLPGFGTHPDNLEHTTYSQWYDYIATFYRELRFRYRFIAVVGTSMGGSMTLQLGETYCATDANPDALTTLAAPVFLNSIKDRAIQDWKMYVARTVALFTPSIGTGIHGGKEEENDGDELWIGYKGQFIRAGLSFLYALKGIRKNLGAITCPLLAIHDENDATVPYANLHVIAKGVQAKPFISKTVHMTSNHNRHVLLMYPSVQKELMDDMLQFFESIRTGTSYRGVINNE